MLPSSPFHAAHAATTARRTADEDVVASVRIQAAVVRTLLDEVDRLVPPGGMPRAVSQQLAEELARLGGRMADLAAEMVDGLRAERAAPGPAAETAISVSTSPEMVFAKIG